MLERYSHIRMKSKRNAMDALASTLGGSRFQQRFPQKFHSDYHVTNSVMSILLILLVSAVGIEPTT